MRMTSCKPAFLLNEYRGAVMLQSNQILYKKTDERYKISGEWSFVNTFNKVFALLTVFG